MNVICKHINFLHVYIMIDIRYYHQYCGYHFSLDETLCPQLQYCYCNTVMVSSHDKTEIVYL